jgi:hypothetical protein
MKLIRDLPEVEKKLEEGKIHESALCAAQTLLGQELSDHHYSTLINKLADLALVKLEKKTPLPPTLEVKQIISETRYIPTILKRAVRRRDQNRCTPTGRYEETTYLKFEHVIPFGQGDKTTYDNLTLFWTGHNRQSAIQVAEWTPSW